MAAWFSTICFVCTAAVAQGDDSAGLALMSAHEVGHHLGGCRATRPRNAVAELAGSSRFGLAATAELFGECVHALLL